MLPKRNPGKVLLPSLILLCSLLVPLISGIIMIRRCLLFFVSATTKYLLLLRAASCRRPLLYFGEGEVCHTACVAPGTECSPLGLSVMFYDDEYDDDKTNTGILRNWVLEYWVGLLRQENLDNTGFTNLE